MNEPAVPEQAVAAAELATRASEAAADAQRAQIDPAHEEFYDLGREMSLTLQALITLSTALEDQVPRYGDRRILRDDAGADPTERLAGAADALDQLGHALQQAREAAGQYWSAIGHIAVEVDPNAPEDA